MKTTIRLIITPASFALATLCPPAFAAEPLGTVLFTLGDVDVVGADGKTHPLKQGAVLIGGEQIITKSGAVAQVLLPDGTRLGVRPESELRFPRQEGGRPAGKLERLDLARGTVRILSDEKAGKEVQPLTLHTPASEMRLVKGDSETVFNPADGRRSTAEQGSFHRLISGKAELVLDQSKTLALRPLEVSAIAKLGTPPLQLSSLPAGTMIFAPADTSKLATATTRQLKPIANIQLDTSKLAISNLAIAQPIASNITTAPIVTSLTSTKIINTSTTPIAPVVTPTPVIPPIVKIFVPIIKYCVNPFTGKKFVC